MLEITLVNSTVELDKSVSGEISWDDRKLSPQSVTLKIGWRTEGRGSKQEEIVTTLELSKQPFSSTIPFESYCIAIDKAVKASIVRGG